MESRIFPVGTQPAEGRLFNYDWFSIRVEQMDKVGRPDIDAFQAGRVEAVLTHYCDNCKTD